MLFPLTIFSSHEKPISISLAPATPSSHVPREKGLRRQIGPVSRPQLPPHRLVNDAKGQVELDQFRVKVVVHLRSVFEVVEQTAPPCVSFSAHAPPRAVVQVQRFLESGEPVGVQVRRPFQPLVADQHVFVPHPRVIADGAVQRTV